MLHTILIQTKCKTVKTIGSSLHLKSIGTGAKSCSAVLYKVMFIRTAPSYLMIFFIAARVRKSTQNN